MSCDGKCDTCPVQCGASKLIQKVKEKTMEVKQKMSEAVGGCHAGSDEKIGRLDERSQFIVERNNSCKWIGVIAMIIAVGGLFIAWTALRDLDAVKKDLQSLSNDQKQFTEKLIDAERAYQNARNTLSRMRRK